MSQAEAGALAGVGARAGAEAVAGSTGPRESRAGRYPCPLYRYWHSLSGALALSGALLAVPALAVAQDAPGEACSEAVRLVGDGDLDGALEEARWCVEGLEQLQRQQTLTAFPDVIDGFAGGEIEDQTTLGMTIIERRYEQGSDVVNVSLTTGGAGIGLAALAQIGMQLGSAIGEKMRIQQRTVIDMSSDAEAQFMAQLRSGGTLMFGSETLAPAALKEFVSAFPLRELDESLDR